LYTVAVILRVLWLLCLVSGYAIGAFIVPTANSGQSSAERDEVRSC
jgi:hypothetical protein